MGFAPPQGGDFMNGGFQPVAFQINYQQVSTAGNSGGWWPDYEHFQRIRRKRRREIEAAEEATQRLADEQAREIAQLLHEQELKDAERADLSRLQRLADTYAGQKLADLPKAARVAILNAQDARTINALQQMQRVLEQSLDEEMIAIQQMILMMDS